MLVGYCRTSTADQNPDHQIDALLRQGVDRDNIPVDVAGGATTMEGRAMFGPCSPNSSAS